MAPLSRPPQDKLEKELKDIVQDLYELMVQAAAYDQVGSGIRSRDVLIGTITHLHQSLLTLSNSANALITPPPTQPSDTPDLTLPANPLSNAVPTPTLANHKQFQSPQNIQIPPELLTYVDGGRNPDIYTREFVELARRGNQILKGKKEAFGGFRDVLAREMGRGLPELREDVARVVESTGGKWEVEVEADVKMEG